MKTALLTAVGSASAGIVIERLHALGLPRGGLRHLPAGHGTLPPARWTSFSRRCCATEADAYVRQMEEAVRRERADVLIPLTDVEVDALCAHKDALCGAGMRALRARRALRPPVPGQAGHGRAAGPRGRLPGDSHPLPLRLGAGGGGLSPDAQAPARPQQPGAGRSPARRRRITRRWTRAGITSPSPIWPGDIYTVDVARDRFGHVQALARHELLRTSNGLGTAVRVLPGHPLEAVCARVAACAGVVGVVNMEFIVNAERRVVSGGQSPLFRRRGLQRAGGRGLSRAQPALPRRARPSVPALRRARDDPGAQGLPGHHRKINFSA